MNLLTMLQCTDDDDDHGDGKAMKAMKATKGMKAMKAMKPMKAQKAAQDFPGWVKVGVGGGMEFIYCRPGTTLWTGWGNATWRNRVGKDAPLGPGA